MKQSKKIGIYIHLPFCQKKCDYCDFYSLGGEHLLLYKERYQAALLAHIALLSPSAKGFQVDTLYFGGGTPTFYGASAIDGLVRAVKRAFRVERTAEITVEANPDSLDKKTVQILRRAGVNRVSLGLQSTNPVELEGVGRIHTAEQSREAVAYLKKAQMKNISLDLIYGLPHQTRESWGNTLEEAIALEPQHLSCYGLKVEEGTPLHQRVAEGEEILSEDSQADLYLWTVERLAQAGYYQYEISNFSQGKMESRHNMGYWQGKPYLGFGASAASDFGGYRYTMVDSVEQYCACVLDGDAQIFSSNQLMGKLERRQEYLFLRLRCTQGIEKQDYETETGLDFSPIQEKMEEFSRESWAVSPEVGHWHFTPQGFLRSNLLLGILLDVQEESGKAKPPPLFVGKFSLAQSERFSPESSWESHANSANSAHSGMSSDNKAGKGEEAPFYPKKKISPPKEASTEKQEISATETGDSVEKQVVASLEKAIVLEKKGDQKKGEAKKGTLTFSEDEWGQFHFLD